VEDGVVCRSLRVRAFLRIVNQCWRNVLKRLLIVEDPCYYERNLNFQPFQHIRYQALIELHWVPVRQRIIYKLCRYLSAITHIIVCLHVRKAIAGQSPSYLCELMHPVADIPSRASLNEHVYSPRGQEMDRQRCKQIYKNDRHVRQRVKN